MRERRERESKIKRERKPCVCSILFFYLKFEPERNHHE